MQGGQSHVSIHTARQTFRCHGLLSLMRNSYSWLIWALSASVLTLIARNPLYVTLIVLATLLVYLAVSRETPMESSWRGLLRLGFFIWLVTIPFSALMNHQGEIVLFALPEKWPLVGGPVTLEAVLAGAASGYALWALLFIFAAFNLAVDATQLMRAAPAFLTQAGVVTTIALTFVPQMLASVREIREAQRIRGHRFRGWRDTLPLAMPLLTTAFEHAVQLSESMESRGLSGELTGLSSRRLRGLRAAVAAGLLLLLFGLLLRLVWVQLAGDLMLLLATGTLIYAFWDLGRHVRRTRYWRQRWRVTDTVISVASLAALAAGLVASRWDRTLLAYAPASGGALLPAFNFWLGLAVVLLAAPGLVLQAVEHAAPDTRDWRTDLPGPETGR